MINIVTCVADFFEGLLKNVQTSSTILPSMWDISALKRPYVDFSGWVADFPTKGKPTATKTDEFSEKFQTIFDSPPFSENHQIIQ